MFTIIPHFQPIVDLVTGDVLGYELLSRGNGPLRSPMALFAALQECGVSQSRIVIEITERVSITDYARFEAVIAHYAGQGFRIALDDFGSGHSGLVTLISSRPHYLKLDMAVTRGVHRDSYKQMIVKSVVALAQNIGAELVAEGVETWDELESLVTYGVRYAQGFLLGRPSTAAFPLAGDVRAQLSHAAEAVAV